MKIEDVHLGDTVRWWFKDHRGAGKIEKDRSHEGRVSHIGQVKIQVACEDGKTRGVYALEVMLLNEDKTGNSDSPIQ